MRVLVYIFLSFIQLMLIMDINAFGENIMLPDRQIPGQVSEQDAEAKLEQVIDERISDAREHYPGLEAVLQGFQGLIVFNGLYHLERTLDTER